MHPIFIDSERLKCSTYPVSSVAHIGDYFLVNENFIKTRKVVPITRRASSFLVFLEFSTKSKREEGRQNNRTINLPKVLHRLQVHNLTLFIIHNKHYMNSELFQSTLLMIMLFIKVIQLIL